MVRRSVEEEMPRQVGWILNDIFVCLICFTLLYEFVIGQTLLQALDFGHCLSYSLLHHTYPVIFVV